MLPPGWGPLESHASLDSTQRRAAELAAAGCPEGAVVRADSQTAGRGRRGRSWHDTPGASLLATLVLRPADPADVPLLGMALGLGIVRSLRKEGLEAALKWPNDVLLADRKVAGILGEVVPGAVLLGFGVNLAPAAVPATEAARATSIGAHGVILESEEALGRFLDAFSMFYGSCGLWDRAAVLDEVRACCVTLGRKVRVELPGERPLIGTADALGEDGRLLVRTAAGLRALAIGDVVHLRAVMSS